MFRRYWIWILFICLWNNVYGVGFREIKHGVSYKEIKYLLINQIELETKYVWWELKEVERVEGI